jgi:amino acid transporter
MFGSLIFVTYTTAKVKQAIAWQRIIPFSSFFGRQDAQFDSPGGGLFLHWIFTVIPILCLGKFTSDPRRFYSGMFSYGYEILTGKSCNESQCNEISVANFTSIHGTRSFPSEGPHATVPK